MPDNSNKNQPLNDSAPNFSNAVPLSSDDSRDESYAPYPLPDFTEQATSNNTSSPANIDEQTLTLTIELGHQLLDQQTVQAIKPGSRIMLKQQATETVDLYVKQQCVGQGELLIRENKLCIRITQLLANTLRRSA